MRVQTMTDVLRFLRLDKDGWALELARLTSKRSTCHRLQVGCVLLNSRGHVLSTGYNGRAAGLPNCNHRVLKVSDGLRSVIQPDKCENSDAPSGQPNGCEAIHAEQNALLQCRDVYQIQGCYVTHSPCVVCTKLLLNTSCKVIVFSKEYPHHESERLWTNAGRRWMKC